MCERSKSKSNQKTGDKKRPKPKNVRINTKRKVITLKKVGMFGF